MSIVLPDYVPLRSNILIRIVDEFFQNRPLGTAGIDDSWMTCPYTMMTKWTHVAWPIHPWLEDFSIARDALRNAGIGSVGSTDTPVVSDTVSGHPRSVVLLVLLVLPVKQLAPAIQSDGDKVNAIALVHWVLAEWIRAVRMGVRASLQDLTILRMPVAIPVRYAKVADGDLHWADDEYNIFIDDLLKRTLPQPVVPKELVDRIGLTFGNLTAGRQSAVILDHILRGDAAAKAGDDVGALLAYATACEVAIVNLTLALRWEDGDNASDVSRELRDTSVSKMVYSLCHRLGGVHERFVGPGQLRDFGLLDSATTRPQSTVLGADAYPSVHEKAAAMLHSLARNHPFIDGNKRTAWAAAEVSYMMQRSLEIP
jgi:hypothetical protein